MSRTAGNRELKKKFGSPEAIAVYLNKAIEQGDAAFLDAVGTVARAWGMTLVAKHTGMVRENLYRSLRFDAKPQFDTITKVLHAFGIRLTFETGSPRSRPRKKPNNADRK